MQGVSYTKGPWTVNLYTADYSVVSTDAPFPSNAERMEALSKIGRHQFKALSVGTNRGQVAIIPLDESNEANAGLIAAAPMMLEALLMQETADADRDVGIRKGYFDRAHEMRKEVLKQIASCPA